MLTAMHAISLVSTRNVHDNIGHGKIDEQVLLEEASKSNHWVLLLLWHKSGLMGHHAC